MTLADIPPPPRYLRMPSLRRESQISYFLGTSRKSQRISLFLNSFFRSGFLKLRSGISYIMIRMGIPEPSETLGNPSRTDPSESLDFLNTNFLNSRGVYAFRIFQGLRSFPCFNFWMLLEIDYLTYQRPDA